MILFLALLLVPILPANSAEPEFAQVDASADEIASSEYRRLAEEMDRLAKRNAWAGGGRTYQKMLETGVTPDFDDLKTAAHAAQARGDIGEARTRLARASTIREEKEVLDWLWAIDSNYGPVLLAGNPGEVALAPKVMPFDPVQARAVQFAVAQVAETGTFEGLLPKGDYTFGDSDGKGQSMEIDVGSSMRKVDLRNDGGVRKSERKKKKKKE